MAREPFVLTVVACNEGCAFFDGEWLACNHPERPLHENGQGDLVDAVDLEVEGGGRELPKQCPLRERDYTLTVPEEERFK